MPPQRSSLTPAKLSAGRRRGKRRVVPALLAALAALLANADVARAQTNPIEAENALPGTTDWLIKSPRQGGIAGYVNQPSYLPGGTVRLFVNSRGAPFSYRVFRMGYYGNTGGRLVAGPVSVASNAPQPANIVRDDRTDGAKLLLTRWHPSTEFTIPVDWTSGVYVVRLTNDNTGAESYAVFVVRAAVPAPVVVVMPTNTWQAYNAWGGLSLYRDKRRRPPSILGTRGHRVSFLRPYLRGHGTGAFFFSERPLVHWLERRGYPVSYATDRDAYFQRLVGAGTKLVVLSGHAEYQSMRERDLYLNLRRRGISLAIFGGNTFVTQARFSPGQRIMTVWRFPRLDPVKNRFRTTRWELAGWPQNRLTGTMDGAGGIGSMVAVATHHWAWKGAAVANGRVIGPVRGNEQDGVVLNLFSPRTLEVLARARNWSHVGHGRIADVVIIPRRNGTFVFNASQNWFTWNLAHPPYPGLLRPASWVGRHYPSRSVVNEPIRRLADNIIVRATGTAHREPTRLPRARVLRYLSIRSPGPGQLVPARRSMVIVWASAPPGTAKILVFYNGRQVGIARPARSTWTGGPGIRTTGSHVIGLTAKSATGRVLRRTSRTIQVVSPHHPAFSLWSPYGTLYRAWG